MSTKGLGEQESWTHSANLMSIGLCGERTALNDDRTRWVVCSRPARHGGEHSDGDGLYWWSERSRPWRRQR